MAHFVEATIQDVDDSTFCAPSSEGATTEESAEPESLHTTIRPDLGPAQGVAIAVVVGGLFWIAVIVKVSAIWL